ncbi:hypothetical protein TWF281_002716 [Arthrobotrys megalospora]
MATQQELDELQDKLDLLIISYLDLFDKYQASRAEISRALTDGFLNLAQANFNAPNRGRYGQDMYDNRMQALRGVRIAVDENDVTAYTLKDLTVPEVTNLEKADPEAPSNVEGSDLELEKEKSFSTPSVKLDDSEAVLTLANSKSDPLRWFGILRPMALGTAQKNFTQSLPPIMELISTLGDIDYHEKRIRAVRQEVRGMRKQLGINVDDGPLEESVDIPELDKLSIGKDGTGDEGLGDNRSEGKRRQEEGVDDQKGPVEIENTIKS